MRGMIAIRPHCKTRMRIMAVAFEEIFAALAPERRARIKAKAERSLAEYQTLVDLREGREPPPEQVAKGLDNHIRQTVLANAEHMAEVLDIDRAKLTEYARRSDVLLLLLQTYIGALDGEFRFAVKLPGERAVALETFNERQKARRGTGGRKAGSAAQEKAPPRRERRAEGAQRERRGAAQALA